ncbi:MAG: pyruvate kinase [Actinomycetota bacterium]|nr:pyruvate kinase [Actinomycetota bacterium]
MRAKIIATIGPSSRDPDTLDRLISAGLAVARLNMAHGDHQAAAADIRAIREASRRCRRPVGIMADLTGPKIRTGGLLAGSLDLTRGDELTLTTEPAPGTPKMIFVSYPELPKDVAPGQSILVADGMIELQVIKVNDHEVTCRVLTGGLLLEHQGINLPQATINTPTITGKDRKDLEFCLAEGVDIVALSFVRSARDIIELKGLIHAAGRQTPVIAKIEKHEALAGLDQIIEAADGVMIARGDLGVELPAEDVPILQKQIVKIAQKKGKASIIATQMLDSMIQSPRPTRAEASDVANAVFDGADAVMLSGETAIGKYPVESVATMGRIVERAEGSVDYDKLLRGRSHWSAETVSGAISYATCHLASVLPAVAIITSTDSGRTAREVSRYRPRAPIVAVSPNEDTVRRLMLWWGVVPILSDASDNIDDMLHNALAETKQAGLAAPGDKVVVTAGTLVNVPGTTNLIKVETIE